MQEGMCMSGKRAIVIGCLLIGGIVLGGCTNLFEVGSPTPTARPSPSLPWPIVKSNSWIRDPVTVQDFVPLGVTFIETEDHILRYTDDPRWKLT